jgi:RNA-binding protein
MLPTKLSGKALRHLRALGHDLTSVLAVGKNGVTESLAKETERALEKHELIKVKVMQEAPVGRQEAAEQLAEKTGAVLAQVLGRTFLLYKRNAKKPKIVLPKPAAPAARDAKSGKGEGEEEEDSDPS